MFEFLFKYPVEYFAEGKLITALPWWQLALLPASLAVLAFVVLGYFRLQGRTRSRDRMTISLLRGMSLSVIIFSLSQPLLEVTTQMQQPGVVGILLDNSISMQLKGPDQNARSDFIRQQFDNSSTPNPETCCATCNRTSTCACSSSAPKPRRSPTSPHSTSTTATAI
jgi:hypothetical protein